MTMVLVVEDEFGIAELLDSVLTDEGYQVRTAMNGRQGLEVLAQERADLVFCDYMMPVMDGAAMLGAMADDPTLRGIPVVMMSSMREVAVAEHCAGYVAFMHKPFKLPELLDVVGRVLGGGDDRAP
jgi:CheY-like chemotaxis protein